MEIDYRIPTALGSLGWTVALVVLLALGDRLPEQDRWWIWVCVTGLGLGIFAYFYIPWLLRRRDKAEGHHAAQHEPETDDAEEEGETGEEPKHGSQ
ncbi:hypothetical protein GCM10022402_41510 [Salinactinospora qingdaonensis]|uniref:DUF2530 domain-containing protein n=2 Tax=Salinactinospora qingdaonensis TaxID=702744 RepID=A0ABP7GD70_9ACTN